MDKYTVLKSKPVILYKVKGLLYAKVQKRSHLIRLNRLLTNDHLKIKAIIVMDIIVGTR